MVARYTLPKYREFPPMNTAMDKVYLHAEVLPRKQRARTCSSWCESKLLEVELNSLSLVAGRMFRIVPLSPGFPANSIPAAFAIGAALARSAH